MYCVQCKTETPYVLSEAPNLLVNAINQNPTLCGLCGSDHPTGVASCDLTMSQLESLCLNEGMPLSQHSLSYHVWQSLE